jgi:GNAT superfamily N-acetyltransferase
MQSMQRREPTSRSSGETRRTTGNDVTETDARAHIVEDLAAIENAPRTLASAGTVQRVLIEVHYDEEGYLRMQSGEMAQRPASWFATFTPAALDAILAALPEDSEDTAVIQQKITAGRTLQAQNVDIEADGSGVTAYANIRQGVRASIGNAEFDEFGDDRLWLTHIDTDAAYQRRGIGLRMLQAAVDEYGAVWASSASQGEHTAQEEDDTRYLTEEGAALVNAAVARGILRPEWVVNPFFEQDHSDEDFDEDEGFNDNEDY